MSDEKIVDVRVTIGNVDVRVTIGNKGDPIASYQRSIVFLPPVCKDMVGQTVRVRLIEIRPDSRGVMMYRGEPAPDEAFERWRENADGTISRLIVLRDWTGTEIEEVAETRQPATVLNTQEIREFVEKFTINWGQSWSDSSVYAYVVQKHLRQREVVTPSGELTWRTLDLVPFNSDPTPRHWQDCRDTTAPCLPEEIRRMVTVPDEQLVNVSVPVKVGDSVKIEVPWSTLPDWVRAEVASLPICDCGRWRIVDVTRRACHECLSENRCAQCGAREVVKKVANAFYCAECVAGAEIDAIVAQLPVDILVHLANEARRLNAGTAIPAKDAKPLLAAGLLHLDEHLRERYLDAWSKFAWTYWTDDGVYGTHVPPTVLKLAENLPITTGRNRSVLLAMLADDLYYERVIGNGVPVWPSASAMDTWVKKGQIAQFLRGTEDERQKALALLAEIETSGSHISNAARMALEHHDYRTALAILHDYHASLEMARRGEIMLDFEHDFRHIGNNNHADAWVIAADGSELEPQIKRRHGYIREGHKFWPLVPRDALALTWHCYTADGKVHEIWNVVKLPVGGCTPAQIETAMWLEPHERFRGEGTGWELTRIGPVIMSADKKETQ